MGWGLLALLALWGRPFWAASLSETSVAVGCAGWGGALSARAGEAARRIVAHRQIPQIPPLPLLLLLLLLLLRKKS